MDEENYKPKKIKSVEELKKSQSIYEGMILSIPENGVIPKPVRSVDELNDKGKNVPVYYGRGGETYGGNVKINPDLEEKENLTVDHDAYKPTTSDMKKVFKDRTAQVVNGLLPKGPDDIDANRKTELEEILGDKAPVIPSSKDQRVHPELNIYSDFTEYDSQNGSKGSDAPEVGSSLKTSEAPEKNLARDTKLSDEDLMALARQNVKKRHLSSGNSSSDHLNTSPEEAGLKNESLNISKTTTHGTDQGLNNSFSSSAGSVYESHIVPVPDNNPVPEAGTSALNGHKQAESEGQNIFADGHIPSRLELIRMGATSTAMAAGSEEKSDVSSYRKPENKKIKKEKNLQRSDEQAGRGTGVLKNLIIYGLCFILAFVIAMLVVKFGAQKTEVAGNSMSPGLKNGDQLIVNKLAYRTGDPKRYDIIVFPETDNTTYVKRIIGLPGEEVSIQNGYVYINGHVLIDDMYGNAPVEADKYGRLKDPVILGSDEYFVMGDNRNNSKDSRDYEVGNISRDKIIGKVSFRIYPFSRFGSIKKADK